MLAHRGKILRLPPNRVWRTYPGGRTLDALAARDEVERVDLNALPDSAVVGQSALGSTRSTPADTHLAEDWIASTTRAVNPPAALLEPRRPRRGSSAPAEGISEVFIGLDATPRDFAQLLASDAEYFLGTAHAKKFGAQPQLLVKFLDSGTRLHFQVHPTREFARKFLGAPSGKTEAYHVLSVRDNAPNSPLPSSIADRAGDAAGAIYVGFQRPPSRAELRRMIEAQDIAAIEACFDKIPVRAGDTLIIPGGTPHALGAGLFLVEIQEPSDLVVRFEFERAGYVLPEPARFMGRGLEFCLDIFNFTPLTAADIDVRVRCRPRRLRALGPSSYQDELIGLNQTDCFRVLKSSLAAPVLKDETSCSIAIVTAGEVTLTVGGETHRLRTYDKVFLPAALGPVAFAPAPSAEILECYPPAAS